MHFALPPRKTSQPPPYARSALRPQSNARRRQLQFASYVVLGVLTLYLLFTLFFSGSSSSTTSNGAVESDPSILIVTLFDTANIPPNQMSMITRNRDHYASLHKYKTFYTNTTTYEHLTDPSPTSWTMIPAIRHALTLHPTIHYVWYLTTQALITNTTLPLTSHILHSLPNLMEKDKPVVPPDSVIHTFSHLRPIDAHLILSHDIDNLAHTSLILRNTGPNSPPLPGQSPQTPRDEYSSFLLDTLFDPLYRAYAFARAEQHALEHMVQWHPTVLSRLVLIPQRMFNSYNYQPIPILEESGAQRSHDSMWQEGDFVVNLKGCEGRKPKEAVDDGKTNCEREMEQYFSKWEISLGGRRKTDDDNVEES